MHTSINNDDTGILSVLKEIYTLLKPHKLNTLCKNKLLFMSVLSLLSKDDIPVYHDMLSISTPGINVKIHTYIHTHTYVCTCIHTHTYNTYIHI